jgi:hypothetical protein
MVMEKGRCKYANGTHDNTHCNAGVAYRDVVPDPDDNLGIAFRYPCTDMARIFGKKRGNPMSPAQAENYARRGACDKYEDPTDEEIAEYERRHEERMQKFLLTLPLISKVKSEHKGENWKGVEACPACSGNLHMTHSAYNGHVWGQCETEGCLSWME